MPETQNQSWLFISTSPSFSSPPPVSSPATSDEFPLAEVISAVLVSYMIVIILVLVLRSYIARRGLTAECCGVSDEDSGFFGGSECCSDQNCCQGDSCLCQDDCCSGQRACCQRETCFGTNPCNKYQTDGCFSFKNSIQNENNGSECER